MFAWTSSLATSSLSMVKIMNRLTRAFEIKALMYDVTMNKNFHKISVEEGSVVTVFGSIIYNIIHQLLLLFSGTIWISITILIYTYLKHLYLLVWKFSYTNNAFY